MKLRLLLATFLISCASFAQCVECNSMKEASKNPLKVKSLIINGGMHESVDTFPDIVRKFENLETLYFTDQMIDSIPPWISELKKLKELSISGCQLTKIPEEMYTMTFLKELLLYSNQFSEAYQVAMIAKFKAKMPGTKVEVE